MTITKGVKRLLCALSVLMSFNACNWKDFIPIYGWIPHDSNNERVTHREQVVSGKILVGLGGTRSGADDYIFLESLGVTDVRNDDEDLFQVSPREGFATIAAGHGMKITPLHEGIGYVTPLTASGSLPAVEVTIPPQKLIQILIGEARGELAREATLENDQVKSSSVSVTGNALASVIHNRISLINETSNPNLFVADPTAYSSNPAISYYEAVIEATNGSVYQFSPVQPTDPSHDEYLEAATRSGLPNDLLNSYDQALLTSGGIFNGSIEDPTLESFAFYSPTAEQFSLLITALHENVGGQLPGGCGTSDGNFPALAPIQVVILPEVASSSTNHDVPSFVFVRSRNSTESVVAGQW